jgi:UDPglucose 6-dehydrogenase
LAFKPGTDDLRDAPAIRIAQELVDAGATVTAYDPSVSRVPEVRGLSLAASAYDAAEQADAVVIATQWPEFLELNFDKLRARMHGTMLLDGRNCVNAIAAATAGLSYQGTGRSAPLRSAVPNRQPVDGHCGERSRVREGGWLRVRDDLSERTAAGQ